MTAISFEQLLGMLPNCPGQPTLPAAGSEAIPHYLPENPTDFTAPSLSPGGKFAPPAAPQVIIVSAAGAVGKSTLAREISRAKAAPYWDLAKARTVGAGSPIGELTEAFTAARLAAVLGDIKAGRLFVVIDALDEARLKVNEQAFLDFLSNMATLTAEGSGVGFILFGRTQIAETALAWLDLVGPKLTTAHFTIDFFDHDRAVSYTDAAIRRELRRVGKSEAVVSNFGDQLVAAREMVFGLLKQAIEHEGKGDGHSGSDFLGYAPVLDAVAVLLARESNYQKLQNELSAGDAAGDNRSVRLLRRVVEAVLSREHTVKLVNNLSQVLQTVAPPKWAAWEALYTPTEQCHRLLGMIAQAPELVGVDNVPQSLRAGYLDAIQSWVPEHPFLIDGKRFANRVFESYVLAHALRSDRPEVRKSAQGLASRSDRLPSRLLADFYLTDSGSGRPRSGELGIIYESILAAETAHRRVRFDLAATDAPPGSPAQFLGATFEWFDPTADAIESAELGEMYLEVEIDTSESLSNKRGSLPYRA